MKFNLFFSLFLGLTLCMFVSCKKEENNTTAQEKLYNLESVGWKSKTLQHHFSKMNYKATQVPLQYYILKNEKGASAEKVDSIYKSMEKERVLEFEFAHDTKDDVLKGKFTNKDYTSSVKYMAFTMKNDFSVVTSSGDTIKCSGVTFERNFKLAPFKRLLLYFEGIAPDDNIKLIYEDKLFKNGIFKFNFKETPIKL